MGNINMHPTMGNQQWAPKTTPIVITPRIYREDEREKLRSSVFLGMWVAEELAIAY